MADVSSASAGIVRLLTPALSSFGEERENYFVGRLPRVVAALRCWANFRSAFSAFEFAAIRKIRVSLFVSASISGD